MKIPRLVLISLFNLAALSLTHAATNADSGKSASPPVLGKPALTAAAITLNNPMPPPEWATLERRFIAEMSAACLEFYDKYYDDQGNLQAVLRWGADDGPDDAFENFTGWPELHALGAPDDILRTYLKGNEGMIRQYTAAKTVETPSAREGMMYKEYIVQNDWMHFGEWSKIHNRSGLSIPTDPKLIERARRYAGFYMDEDPDAPNYDPKLKLIRSLLTGSRGPMLRPATSLDWVGDPIDISKFPAVHGEADYQGMLDHYKEYTDVVGDSFLNLGATTLPTTAYMLTHDPKYKKWVLEYMDAWLERMKQNNGVIPSYVALDGKIGGPEGKWWGNAYGWGFSPVSTSQASYGRRENRNRIPRALVGFIDALWLSGDQKYVDAWRNMITAVNSHATTTNGRTEYPSMCGADGWYGWTARPWSIGALEVWYWSMKAEDLDRVAQTPWVAFLQGQNPDYPLTALQRDYASMQRKIQNFRADQTTPQTRLADNELNNDPANGAIDGLLQLMMGCLPKPDGGNDGGLINARLRYFDPVLKRAGLPADVGVLVSGLTDTTTTVTFVNLNKTESRTFVVQGGAYAEHAIDSIAWDNGKRALVNGTSFTLTLAPGAGDTLTLTMKRYSQDPTELFPWDQK
jgi:hypothetical protein